MRTLTTIKLIGSMALLLLVAGPGLPVRVDRPAAVHPPESAEVPDYRSDHLAIGLSPDRPAFRYLTVDSLGGGDLDENPVLQEEGAGGPLRLKAMGEGRFEYSAPAVGDRSAVVWTVTCSAKVLTLRSEYAAGRAAPPFVLTFDQKANHATLLGMMKEGERSVSLPCLLHLPDRGSFRISGNGPGQALDYDARRYVKVPFVRVAFPGATSARPQVEYKLEVAAIHPNPPGLGPELRFEGFRRSFLNIFQVNPRVQMLANNASSDPVPFTLYMSAMVAAAAPPLADGLTCLDLVRMTLDRYLAGAKGYGLIGYAVTPGEADLVAWKAPWNSLDTFPSLVQAACTYAAAAGDRKWAAANYDKLAAWVQEMSAADKNGDGLLEHPHTGNSGDRATAERRPSNWWDTINFGHDDAYSNALAYRGFLQFAELARGLGRDADAATYETKAARLKAAYKAAFLNPATGLLAGWRSADGKLHDYAFTFVNGLAVAFELLDGPDANAVMDRLLVKMAEVGFTSFRLGLPGNLVPVRKEDYVFHNWDGARAIGEPSLDDGSDAFQIYENGGATACYAYFTVKALYRLGRAAEARRLFYPMLDGFAAGDFQGFCSDGKSKDWRDWSGGCHGYEGLLADGYLALLGVLDDLAADRSDPPPNEPARIDVKDGRVLVAYAGRTIFEGTLAGDPALVQARVQAFQTGDKVDQVLYIFGGGRPPLKLSGTVLGSEEAFPCESDRRDRRGAGPLVVRHVSGISRSLLNRAVYDRRRDWVLSVDAGPAVTVGPAAAGPGGNSFGLSAEGGEIVLRFRPRFYQKHRGLAFYEPWTYKPWPSSVAGWISWFAFYADITEKDAAETADVFASVLGPYGYDHFQIDDGFQQIQGAPEKWLTPNAKFPRGLKFLADHIRSRGLKPGLWTAASMLDGELPEKRPEWFVRDPAGVPVKGNWVGWVLDASNDEALENVVRPLYRGLVGQGWDYIKLDALRHLRYEGYNANRAYFERKKADPVAAFRKYVQVVRETIGRDRFLLACWGIRPELIGLADACRIGDDGFAYAGLAQYNSFNNIVWRNDPDHIELDSDGYRSTLVTTLTGSLMMLTDKPAVYRTAAVEPAKRTAPVLFTRPGQIYDVDPSRSDQLGRVDFEVSGGGPRPFDGGYTPSCFLYSLEVDRPFESWLVLGRTGGEFAEIRLADLGLDPIREYFVFEFWSKRLLGGFTGAFAPGALDPRFRSQAFIIRERKAHPQILATSRHVTGGGVDLDDVRWNGTALAGKSRGVVGDPYVLYLTETDGLAFDKLEASGAKVERTDREGRLVKITLAPESSAAFAWTARFKAGS